MEHVDEKAFVFYDYVPPLQYKGASAVRSRLDALFQEAKDLKGEFVELEVVADDKLERPQPPALHLEGQGREADGGDVPVSDVFHQVGGKWGN